MGHTHKKELEEQCASILNRAWKSMIDGGLGARAPRSPMNGGGVIPEDHSIIFFIATRERCGQGPSRSCAKISNCQSALQTYEARGILSFPPKTPFYWTEPWRSNASETL